MSEENTNQDEYLTIMYKFRNELLKFKINVYFKKNPQHRFSINANKRSSYTMTWVRQ